MNDLPRIILTQCMWYSGLDTKSIVYFLLSSLACNYGWQIVVHPFRSQIKTVLHVILRIFYCIKRFGSFFAQWKKKHEHSLFLNHKDNSVYRSHHQLVKHLWRNNEKSHSVYCINEADYKINVSFITFTNNLILLINRLSLIKLWFN